MRQKWHCPIMMLGATLLTLLLGLSTVPASAKSGRDPLALCPADAQLASLLAGSDVVLIGRMNVPEERLTEEAGRPRSDSLDIPIQIESAIKGESDASAAVRFFPRDTAYKPANDAIVSLAGERAILFLTRVDDGPAGLYFAGHTPDSMKRATDQVIAATRAEAARQSQIIASWRVDTALPHLEEVRRLLARLGQVSGNEQQRVFDRLEELGIEAVPAIIAQMNDRRFLRTRAIFLVNHAPDAFEEMRHYAPVQVVDGLDAVLNQITSTSFGSIVNGGSNRQRDATVAGWRIYAADLACEKGK